ncbi:MAG: hypothetical protein A2182_03150 [Candidatus Pacebacteria bacterium RIFOXYA1_FULL_38_18]|nr:MAG: hypothetical protein A2182_03150 [Candidatus Pacebacteria bacterium RIFOXYA1_FULL_38_18]OGJ39469.1 MAG: hypothetical protein A2411_01790 [Candidatus Pacebacteria bacterium RIFOXYC1_FULL_39_21]
MAKHVDKIAILLKTYIGDIDYVKKLIGSFKKYNKDKITLYIVVPKSDIKQFKKFTSNNIKLLSDESVTNELVHDSSIRGIRPGYINQEIIKLSFWEKGLCENYFCMDSDGVFIRNFYISDFMYDENVPFTILKEDNEFIVDPEYFRTHWRGREKLIKKIQEKLGLVDKRMLTCHGFGILSSKVLKSFYTKFLLKNHLTYKDILKISPYEFSWYNMWLQKDKTIPIEFREPLVKSFHNKTQHWDYLRKGIKISDIARGYIGLNINSNYSRGFGMISYQDEDAYIMPLTDIIFYSKKIIKSVVVQSYRKLVDSGKKVIKLIK